jgi:peptide/nickel transport system ATP-binding protein
MNPMPHADPQLAVSAIDLSIKFHQRRSIPVAPAVSGATFEIRRGETLAVIGESGSGKSALASVLAGEGDLDVPASPRITGGAVTVLGTRLRRVRDGKRERLQARIGYVPQGAGARLVPHLTAGESIGEPIFARNRRFNQRRAGMIVATLVDAVRLPMGTMNKFPYELSAGQRQRIAIARALVLEPELLIADDPTSGVDVTARPAIIDIIHELQSDLEFSAFVVTSNLHEVQNLSENVMVMYHGMVVANGNLDQVLADPHHPYVATLARTRDLGRDVLATDREESRVDV